MTINENRDVAIRLIQSISAGEPEWSALTPDAVWWVLGRGEYPARAFLEATTKQVFKSGRTEVLGSTAEGNRVALETRSFQQVTDGRQYSNCYHMLFEFENGLVCRVKEYLDTAYANRFYGVDMFGAHVAE